MNTQDKNKLIAEFMMFETVGDLHLIPFDNTDNDTYLSKHMKFHSSWDWLMPVVEKCLVGEAEHTEEAFINAISNIYEGICSQDIYQAHQSVVEFINEYNKNQ